MFPTHYFRFTGEKYEKVCTMRADCDFRPSPCTLTHGTIKTQSITLVNLFREGFSTVYPALGAEE